MKRYWKFISLIIVIIVVFSVFYSRISYARNNVPEMTIKHVSGDHTLIKDLQLYIWYQDDNNSRDFILTDDGMTLKRPPSYLNMILDDFYPSVIKQLQANYRGFMRDKQEPASKFFENEDAVAFADVQIDYIFSGIDAYDFTFEIEVLNKHTKEENRFTIPVPKKDKYNYLFIEDVQLINENELKVFTLNMLNDRDIEDYELYYHLNHDEIHVYTFDLTQQTIVNDEIVNTVDVDVNSNLSHDTMIIDHVDDIGPKEYIIYNEIIHEVAIDENQHYGEQLIENNLLVYHVATGEQRVLRLPDKIKERYSPHTYNNDSNFIYFESFMPDQYEVIKYNVEQEEIEVEQTFVLEKQKHNADISNDNGYDDMYYEGYYPKNFVLDDYVYMFEAVPINNGDRFIQVRDIYTGDLLYEGQLEIEEKFADHDFYMEIYDVDFNRY